MTYTSVIPLTTSPDSRTLYCPMGRTLVERYGVIAREKLMCRLNPWELWEDKKE